MNGSTIKVKENAAIGEKYYYIKHKSGLDIYVIPKKLSTYYAMFGTKYGSVHNKFRIKGEEEYTEVPDGIAHFLEHKMFENEDGVDTFARFAETGASANAYTSFLCTMYLFSCTDNFDESLEILLDYVTKPYFTEQSVQKEQGIIAQEIRMGEDNPGRALLFGMLRSMYKNHNARIDIAGTVESIAKIDHHLLYKCYNTFYNLGNMALCVSGDVTPEQVIAVADKVLKPQETHEVECVQYEEEPQVYRPRFSRRMQVAKPLFAIGVKDVELSEDPYERMKKNAAMTVLVNMLFGRASEFFNELYKEGLISQNFGAWHDHNHSMSLVCIQGDSDQPEKVYERFVEYIDKMKREGLSADDFERCHRVMYSSYIKGFDSTAEIVNNFLGNFVFEGGDMLDYADIIRGLDFDYTSAVFNTVFEDTHYTLATVLPLEESEKV
ncbi:MAG: EF-P 5-aminopentanol modification-associated protein YfmH [Eubacteriales bacterium]|nr:insulinase family protein [Clostridiales bacterium]